jgi:hypothetical protein
VIALAASRGAGLRAPRPAFPAAALRVVAPALALVAGALLALPARHFVARHAQTRALATADVVALLAADPGYRSDRAAVATTASYIPELAGDRLEHRIGTLSPHAPCAEVAARAHAGWLIYGAPPGGRLASPVTPCLAGVRPRQAGEAYVVFAPRP